VTREVCKARCSDASNWQVLLLVLLSERRCGGMGSVASTEKDML
jgi:hypothetical protein